MRICCWSGLRGMATLLKSDIAINQLSQKRTSLLKNSLMAALEPFEESHGLHFAEKSCSNLGDHTLPAPRVDC